MALPAVPMTVDAATLITTVAMTSLVDVSTCIMADYLSCLLTSYLQAAPIPPLARLAQILAHRVVPVVVDLAVAQVAQVVVCPLQVLAFPRRRPLPLHQLRPHHLKRLPPLPPWLL